MERAKEKYADSAIFIGLSTDEKRIVCEIVKSLTGLKLSQAIHLIKVCEGLIEKYAVVTPE